MIGIIAASAVMLAPASPAQTQAAPPPLTFEEKAGCGVALTLLAEGITKIPGALASAEPETVPMIKMMMRVMGEQGGTLLTEAFAEGAARQMTPMQVYQAGLNDMFTTLGSADLESPEQAGELMMKRFMSRCVS